jgi:hypothetical protein
MEFLSIDLSLTQWDEINIRVREMGSAFVSVNIQNLQCAGQQTKK